MGEVAISRQEESGRRVLRSPIIIRRSDRSSLRSSQLLGSVLRRGHAENNDQVLIEQQQLEEARENASRLFKRHRRYANKEQKELRDIITRAPGRTYSEKVMRLLFTLWAANYDNHMIEHEQAIVHLVNKALDLNNLNRSHGMYPIFGKRVLEMSCGTGTVLDLISRAVPPELAREMIVTANDITPEMQIQYLEKLHALPDSRMPSEVRLPNHDLRALDPSMGEFDIAILSQTLHLITDPVLMDHEKDVGFANGGEHRQIKLDVISNVFELLAENGVFMMIDEWDPTLSVGGEMNLISSLFRETFRPIVKRFTFRKDIMGEIPWARLEAELKAKIDPKHNMYVFVYRKDPDRYYERGKYCPESWTKARQDAVEKLIERIKATDKTFRSSFAPEDEENKVQFMPICEGRTLTSNELITSFRSKYDTINLIQNLHSHHADERDKMIAAAVEALNPGGSLILIDEWKSPYSRRNTHMRKSHLRGMMATRFERNMMFEGTLRVPIKEGFDNGMYLFAYRKISD